MFKAGAGTFLLLVLSCGGGATVPAPANPVNPPEPQPAEPSGQDQAFELEAQELVGVYFSPEALFMRFGFLLSIRGLEALYHWANLGDTPRWFVASRFHPMGRF